MKEKILTFFSYLFCNSNQNRIRPMSYCVDIIFDVAFLYPNGWTNPMWRIYWYNLCNSTVTSAIPGKDHFHLIKQLKHVAIYIFKWQLMSLLLDTGLFEAGIKPAASDSRSICANEVWRWRKKNQETS